MQEHGDIHFGKHRIVTVFLCKNYRTAHEGEHHTHQQSQGSGHHRHDEILGDDLRHYLHAGASEGPTYTDFAHSLAESALRHATDVDGRYYEQNQEDNELLATMGRKVRLPIGCKGDGLLLLVVRTITGNDFPTVLANKLVVFRQSAIGFFADGIKITTALGKDGTAHHAHVAAGFCILIHTSGCIRHPELSVGIGGEGRDILYHTAYLIRGMVQQEFFTNDAFCCAKYGLGYCLRNHGYRNGGLEGGLVVRLSVDELEIEYLPEGSIRLTEVETGSCLLR